MTNPGDLRTMGCIEGCFLGEDRQDAIGKRQKAARAVVIHAPSPFLWGDVVGDRHLRQFAAQTLAQTHIGAHVVNQHHCIGRPGTELLIDTRLQLQRRHDLGKMLQQTDRTQWSRIGKQFRTGCMHPWSPQGQHLEIEAPQASLAMKSLNQKASLKITRHLTGADQHTHHQRPPTAGMGPRRP